MVNAPKKEINTVNSASEFFNQDCSTKHSLDNIFPYY